MSRYAAALAENDTQRTHLADTLAQSRELVAGLREQRQARETCCGCGRTITESGQHTVCIACEVEIDRDLATERLRSAVEVLGVIGAARELQRMAGIRITVGGAR